MNSEKVAENIQENFFNWVLGSPLKAALLTALMGFLLGSLSLVKFGDSSFEGWLYLFLGLFLFIVGLRSYLLVVFFTSMSLPVVALYRDDLFGKYHFFEEKWWLAVFALWAVSFILYLKDKRKE